MLDERRVDVAHAVEAQVETVFRETFEEGDEGARVASSGRPQPERRAVAEDHVHRDGRRSAQTAPTSDSLRSGFRLVTDRLRCEHDLQRLGLRCIAERLVCAHHLIEREVMRREGRAFSFPWR